MQQQHNLKAVLLWGSAKLSKMIANMRGGHALLEAQQGNTMHPSRDTALIASNAIKRSSR